MTGGASRSSERGQPEDHALFYYFLLGVDGAPHEPAVLRTTIPDPHVGETLVLDDGARVRVRTIEMTVDGDAAGRGLDGVLVVEPQPRE